MTHEANNTAELVSLGWGLADRSNPDLVVDYFRKLHQSLPHIPEVVYALAGSLDFAGNEVEALTVYGEVDWAALEEKNRHHGLIRYASTLRNNRRWNESIQILDAILASSPTDSAAACFLALSLLEAGRGQAAVGRLILNVLETNLDPDLQQFSWALKRYASQL